MQSSISNRQATHRKPDNGASVGGPVKFSRSSSFAEKISSWSKRTKSTDQEMSYHPPASVAYTKPSNKEMSSSTYPMNNDKANRSSSVRLVEGISKVHASGSKNRLYPPRADETVVTASTASVSLQNSMSAEDESTFYAKSSTKLIANLPLGRPVLDGRKAPETSQRTLPFKHHSFLAGNNTFTIDNRYNLVKVIGSGAYGVVISATDSSSTGENKNVAIKMVPKAFQDEVDAKRILREIKLLQHFRHDNIVSIIDMMPSLVTRSIEEFKDVYIVTDLMETDLHRIIYSKQALSADHSQYFVYQILRALKYIHSANVLHRDLKPSNILVNANCDLKICDFGLARGFHPTNEDCEDETMAFDGIGHNKNSMSNQLLTEYVVTRWYRAPEIMLACRQYSKPVDVWSVGCIMAELLGRKPFLPGNDYIEQLTLITKKLGKLPEHEQDFITSEKAKRFLSKFPDVNPPSLSSQFPGAHPDAIDLMAKMLTVHPRKRITVNQALQHPYFASLHSTDDEPVADRPFDFSFEDEKLYRVRIQELIWKEVCRFRPACLPLPPRRELQIPDRR